MLFTLSSVVPSIRPGRPTGNKLLRRVVADGDREQNEEKQASGVRRDDDGRASKLMSIVPFYARYVPGRSVWPRKSLGWIFHKFYSIVDVDFQQRIELRNTSYYDQVSVFENYGNS